MHLGKQNDSANETLALLRTSFFDHLNLIDWYIGFLKSELQPTSSYQAHITSLSVLTILLQHGCNGPDFFGGRPPDGRVEWPWKIQIFSPGMNRMLLDLMVNPFDDVRGKSVNILRRAHKNSAYLYNTWEKTTFIRPRTSRQSRTESSSKLKAGVVSRAWLLMNQTGRPDHSDGFARSLDLLFDRTSKSVTIPSGAFQPNRSIEAGVELCEKIVQDLEMKLQMTLSSPDKMIIGTHISGLLTSLRRVIECCEQIWDCVRKVLCDDSPEGIISEDNEDEFELGAKDRLSYSWRALMDSSCLLRGIVMTFMDIRDIETSKQVTEDLLRIGRLSFEQLAELRHRGAFSSVSQTFAACCRVCVMFRNTVSQDMLRKWYEETLSCIHDKASTITRRSAGIPSLITGILSANAGGELFIRGMTDLQSIARAPIISSAKEQESWLPQVHALNCLKDIFMSSKLGPSVEPYVAQGLDIAVYSLESQMWPIRNCGVMLYKALIDRIFGNNVPEGAEAGHLTKSTSRMSYGRAPEIAELLPRLLRTDSSLNEADPVDPASSLSVEAIFPALELFRRAGPPPGRYDLARDAITYHLGSQVWLVRAMAARTFNSFVQDRDGIEEINRLFQSSYLSHNELHGRLLAVKYILETILVDDDVSITILRRLLDSLDIIRTIMIAMRLCSVNVALLLDVMNIVTTKYLGKHYSRSNELLERFVCLLSSGIPEGLNNSNDTLLNRATLLSRSLSHLASRNMQALGELIMSVSTHDPDSTRSTLIRLSSLHSWAFVKELGRDDWYQLAQLYTKLRASSKAAYVKEVATSNLAELLEALDWIGPQKVTDITQEGSCQLVCWESSEVAQSPALADAELRLRGSVLAVWCSDVKSWPEELQRRINIWVHMLISAGHERTDFPTRKAAVQSLSAFKRVFRPSKSETNTNDHFLGAYLVLYDTLNDDDEELREMGASIVSYILSDPSKNSPDISLIPLSAGRRFSQWLSVQYNQSPYLCINATSRLTGAPQIGTNMRPSPNFSLDHSISSLLTNARKVNTTLFAEEKQNLFLNPVKEAETWSCILKQLSPSAVDANVAACLAEWTLQGLRALTATAEKEFDGPLGWTAKPEVFTLGMRVVLAAEVVRCWARKSVKGVLGKEVEITDALTRFVDVGCETAVHELWLERAERAIAGDGGD
ncbi:MAG: hypothetical protein M1816_002735 [Peltula sp. TS41687]|nr:MAG: hypothetical protein M1816_002735 [Peltula sp. TS41687]